VRKHAIDEGTDIAIVRPREQSFWEKFRCRKKRFLPEISTEKLADVEIVPEVFGITTLVSANIGNYRTVSDITSL
jgi:hypothetical protein